MRNRLDEVMDGRLTRRMQDRGLDLHAVLTLASLVEKETGAAHERPHIAGVFFNRLRKKMKLQTDPTSVYGVADHDGTISRSDLQRDHPYNTYVIPGLPPGPIAQPGLAAIKAVLWPDTTDDLFFVARGASGEHEFCPTLACHNDAVQRWQRRTDDSGEGSRASTGTANTDAAGGADRTPDDAGEATATRADIAVDQEGPPDAGVIDGGTAPNASSAVTQTPTEGRSPPSQDTSAPSTEHKDIPKRAH